MTTERPLPIPPSPTPSPGFSFSSPVKNDPNLKPNPHPYAIKTTTSALLSRSNSSGHNVDTTRHYYVPLSPNANRSPETGKSHKASKSLSNLADSPTRSSPRPLPVPPGFSNSGTAGDLSAGDMSVSGEENVPSRRSKRADTLPSFPTSESTQLLVVPDDLPNNPKLWTPSHLSTYLVTALRVTNHARQGESQPVTLPVRVAKDIAAFAKARLISGRMFLRLTEADLESMGVNKKWREALLAASHELRQNVLKGRIWGPEVSPTPSPGTTSPLPMAPFSSSLYNSSSSSLELSVDEGEADGGVPRRGRHRNGRVRGMVETFERSGSFSSEGSFDDEHMDERSKLGRWLREEGPIDDQPLRSPSPVARKPAPGTSPERHAVRDDEEPTVEELLAAAQAEGAPTSGHWGARAWEEMDLVPGVTVKRISEPEGLIEDAERETHRTITGPGSGKHSGGKRDREERRVVTAIFAPDHATPVDSLPEQVDEETRFTAELEMRDESAQTELDSHRPQDEYSQTTKRLEQELADTRALVDAFRKRLEAVERKVTELERLEADRQAQMLLCKADDTEQIGRSPGEAESEQGYHTDRRPGPLQPLTLFSSTSSLLPDALRRLNSSGHTLTTIANPRATGNNDKDDDDHPSTISDLPSYILLVGFGVCAVVLRVVLKRVAGKSAITAWKT